MRLEDRLRNWLAERLPRWLALALRVRRVAPIAGREPWHSYQVDEADTGGGFRAAWRPQDPSLDPREPGGGESSSAGNDHGWSNCTVASGAMALAYQRAPNQGSLAPWGGDLRHRQSDLSGGTDLYDVREAWAEYGETLTIKSGAGWAAVRTARSEGRAIVIQGEGNVPGSESFSGGHGCVISPEVHSGGSWLFGDPLASGWQWVSESSIRTWAEAWQSSIAFAVGEKAPATPPPNPEPEPPKPAPAPTAKVATYLEGYDAGRLDGIAEHTDEVFRSWQPGRPFDPPDDLAGAQWGYATWAGAPVVIGDPWASWPLPLRAVYAAQFPAEWSSAGWTASVWRE